MLIWKFIKNEFKIILNGKNEKFTINLDELIKY